MFSFLLTWTGLAFAADPPEAALRWAAIFDQTLPQYKQVQQQYLEPASVAPACAVTEGCEALTMMQWSLIVAMEPQDRRRYSPAQIRIHPLGDQTPAQWLSAIVDRAQAPARASVAGLLVGDYWVELTIPCTVGNLLPYEAVDLARHIQTQRSELRIHNELAWSPCIQGRFETRTMEWLATEAKIEREQWGILLPQGRVVLELPD
jgi:hypothetical protein